jgi:hypothetical protein
LQPLENDRCRLACLHFLFLFLLYFPSPLGEGLGMRVQSMEYRSTKIPSNLDAMGSIANSLVMQATGKRLLALFGQSVTGTGDGAGTFVAAGAMLIPKSVGARWRVVGVGAYVFTDGASTVAEKIEWGHHISDLGATDYDAFGSFVQDTTADKQIKFGDFIYQGVAPFDDYFEFDALANAGTHTWDISGAGAGLLMGDWQTKSAHVTMVKQNVASSTATVYPIFLIEYETGGGIT